MQGRFVIVPEIESHRSRDFNYNNEQSVIKLGSDDKNSCIIFTETFFWFDISFLGFFTFEELYLADFIR